MQRITAEVFSWKLPVGWEMPSHHATDHFGTAFPAIPGIQQDVQIHPHVAQVVFERRRREIPGGKYRAFVVHELSDVDQTPLDLIETFAQSHPSL